MASLGWARTNGEFVLIMFQTDSERRLGTSSVLLGTTDDGDSKRAKLSLYTNRAAYTRAPSTSVTGSSYSSIGLSNGSGTRPPALEVNIKSC